MPAISAAAAALPSGHPPRSRLEKAAHGGVATSMSTAISESIVVASKRSRPHMPRHDECITRFTIHQNYSVEPLC